MPRFKDRKEAIMALERRHIGPHDKIVLSLRNDGFDTIVDTPDGRDQADGRPTGGS